MTAAMLKAVGAEIVEVLTRHTDDGGDMLVILGSVVTGIARSTTNPIDTARAMIEGLEGWIQMYEAEQKARSC